MYLKEEAEVESLFYAHTNSYPAGLADFLGVSHVSSATNVFRWQSRPSAHPVITGGQQPVYADGSTTLAVLASDQFNSEQEVYLPSRG